MKKIKGSTITLQEYFYENENGKRLFIGREIYIDNQSVYEEKIHPNLRGSHKELDAFYQWLLLTEKKWHNRSNISNNSRDSFCFRRQGWFKRFKRHFINSNVIIPTGRH